MQLALFLTDGREKAKHYTDGMVWDGEVHTVTFVVDIGPRIVTSVLDERLCDGGENFPDGWTTLDEVSGSESRRTSHVPVSGSGDL